MYTLSKYNYFQNKKERIICINFLSKNIFGISKESHRQLMEHSLGLNELERENPSLFSLMYKLGIICKKTEDLQKQLLLANRKQIYASDFYQLIINPTVNCNFACWYCYESHIQSKMEESTLLAISKHIENTVKERHLKRFFISWFGGEPLLKWKDVMKPISLLAKDICQQNEVALESGITTNGFLITEEIIEFFKTYNFKSIQITLDGNEENHNKVRFLQNKEKTGSYTRIIRNIIKILDAMPDITISVRINYTAESLDTCPDIISAFPLPYRKQIKILLVQVWQDQKENPVSIKHIHKLRNQFKSSGYQTEGIEFNTKGYVCYADRYRQAVINYDGRVYKCTARDFTEENKEGILTDEGKIVWDKKRLTQRLSKATFENKKCMDCPFLPVCFGRCSQKTFMDERPQNIRSCPIRKLLKDKIDIRIREFEKSGLKLDQL